MVMFYNTGMILGVCSWCWRWCCFDDDEVRQSVVLARQDLRLIAHGVAAILVMLSVIADKIR
jgi:hypothetical protein